MEPTDIVASEPSKPRNDDATDSDTDDESEAATDVNAKGNSLDGLNENDYEINFEINGVLPSLDIVYESAREKVQQAQLPLTVGPMTFLSFGNLPEDNDLLDVYHSEHYLYPIGFKAYANIGMSRTLLKNVFTQMKSKMVVNQGLFLLYRSQTILMYVLNHLPRRVHGRLYLSSYQSQKSKLVTHLAIQA